VRSGLRRQEQDDNSAEATDSQRSREKGMEYTQPGQK